MKSIASKNVVTVIVDKIFKSFREICKLDNLFNEEKNKTSVGLILNSRNLNSYNRVELKLTILLQLLLSDGNIRSGCDVISY